MKNFLFKFFFSLFLLFLCFKLNNINYEIVNEIIRFDIVLTTVSILFLSFTIFLLFIRNSILNNFLVNKNFDKAYFFTYLKSLVLSNLGFAGAGEIYRIFYRKKANLSLNDVTNVIFFERATAFLSILFLLFIFSQFNFIYLFIFIFFFYFFLINKKFFFFILKSPYINIFNNRLRMFLLTRNMLVIKLFKQIFIISITIQLLSILFSYSFFAFFSIDIAFYEFTFIVLLINLFLAIPNLTISGVGLREMLYLFLIPVSIDRDIIYQTALYQSIFLILFWIVIFLVTLTLDIKYPTKNQKKIYSK